MSTVSQLERMTDDDLRVKLALAHTARQFAQDRYTRDKASREVVDIQTEIDRRLPE